jgi:hypothetical protein
MDTVKVERDGKTIERKASSSSRKKKKKKKKQSTTNGQRGPKNQDQVNKEDANQGIDLIISIPHDGKAAYEKWGPNALPKAEFAYAWLGEFLAAAKENAA